MSIELITPSAQFVDDVNGFHIMRKLEKCARTCYQSEFKQHTKPTADFLRGIIKSGHTSVLEHQSVTVDVTTSRDVLAEWTRHRIGVGYSVESTRYVNYSKGVEFIIPVEYDENAKVFPDGKALDIRRKIFQEACETAAYAYNQLIKNGAKPQEARAVLPQALKVNMKVTMNIRAWRHFFELRCASSAHPNMREIAIAILLEFRKKMPPLFEDIQYDEDFYMNHKQRIDNIFYIPNKLDVTPARNVLDEMELIDNHEKFHEKIKSDINHMGKTWGVSINAYDEIPVWMREYMKNQEKEKIDKMTAAMTLDEKDDEKAAEPSWNHERQPITRREAEHEKIVHDIENLLKKHITRLTELEKGPSLTICDLDDITDILHEITKGL